MLRNLFQGRFSSSEYREHRRMEQSGGGILTEFLGRVAFANYLPLLMRATSEDETVTPSYMLQEMEKITFQLEPHCLQLTEYLARRLSKPSAVVKLKILKIMLHLVHNGHVNFRLCLKRNESALKEASSFHGPSDPLLGTSRYELIRKLAQELLQELFYPASICRDEELQLGGLGSTGSNSGKYQGFGSSPIEKEDTITDKVMDIFEKLVNPVDETAEVIRSALTSSLGSYQAVQVEHHPPSIKKSISDTLTTRKAHMPGRAGGGWESDDEEMKKSQRSSSLNSEEQVSADSLDNLEPPSLDELQIVTTFCNIPKLPCSPSELNEISKKCAVLNCLAVLRVLSDVLQVRPNDITVTRALLLLEWLLRMDIVRVSVISNLMSSNLAMLIDPDVKVGQEVKMKAGKVILILGKLNAL